MAGVAGVPISGILNALLHACRLRHPKGKADCPWSAAVAACPDAPIWQQCLDGGMSRCMEGRRPSAANEGCQVDWPQWLLNRLSSPKHHAQCEQIATQAQQFGQPLLQLCFDLIGASSGLLHIYRQDQTDRDSEWDPEEPFPAILQF